MLWLEVAAFCIGEESVDRFGDVADVEADGSEAVWAQPDLLVGEASGCCDHVFFCLLERAEEEMTERIGGDGEIS